MMAGTRPLQTVRLFPGLLIDTGSWDRLVKELNGLNHQWVVAMRRLSPRLLTDLMISAGGQVNEYFGSLDLTFCGTSCRLGRARSGPHVDAHSS